MCMGDKLKKPRWAQIAERLMGRQELRQLDLAKCLGVTSRGAVGHYMCGRREPSIEQLQALSKKLGVTVSELIGEIPLTGDPQDRREIDALLAVIDDDRKELMLRLLRAAAEGNLKS